MPLYQWKGINQQGKYAKGVDLADDPEHLTALLLCQGIALIDYHQTTGLRFDWYQLFLPSIGPSQLADFWEQLALLLGNGVELCKALEIVARVTTHKRLQSVIRSMSQAIAQGQGFYEALGAYPKIFAPVVVQLVEAGERTGKLGFILERIKDYYKQQYVLSQQLKRAALAPLITFGVALVLVGAIVMFIVPQFASLYQSLGSKIPISTKFLISLSNACRSRYAIIIVLVIIGVLYGIIQLFKTTAVKKVCGKVGLHIPMTASIVQYHNVVIFIQTLSIFTASGLTLTSALEHAAHTVRSELFKEDIKRIIQEIMAGKSLSEAMALIGSQFLPEQLVALMHVGEDSGTLPEVLAKTEIHYQDLLAAQLTLLTALFSPLLMIVVGMLIAGIMVVLYLPIFNLGNLIRF